MKCAIFLLSCALAVVVCQPPGQRTSGQAGQGRGAGGARGGGPGDRPSGPGSPSGPGGSSGPGGPGGPGGRGFGGPCKIVDVATNVTTERFTCPDNDTCTLLDPFNPDASTEVYLCSGVQLGLGQRPLRRVPCRVIDLTSNTTTEGPASCPPSSSCSELDTSSTEPNVQSVYCTRPSDRPAGAAPGFGRSDERPRQQPHCKVVLLATKEVLSERTCVRGSCTEMDTSNTDPAVAKYLCSTAQTTEQSQSRP